MRAGLGVLRLPPKSFWSMTLPELLAAIGPGARPAGLAPSRAELEALMCAYPDQGTKQGRA